jgi:hypothetical protein
LQRGSIIGIEGKDNKKIINESKGREDITGLLQQLKIQLGKGDF